MSGEIEVTQLVETIEVKAGDTVEVTQQLSTIEVVDGDQITVTETQDVVELKAGDVIEVAEEILQVVIDASGGGGGVSAHSALSGIGPDDHHDEDHTFASHFGTLDFESITGTLIPAQHGVFPSDDLHTDMALLAGRAGKDELQV